LLKNVDFTEQPIRGLAYAFTEKSLVVVLDLDILTTASSLREQHAFCYRESMLISNALHTGVGLLYSEDFQHELVIDRRLRIINPFRG
jgi:predicted nucleic acid-binding protein